MPGSRHKTHITWKNPDRGAPKEAEVEPSQAKRRGERNGYVRQEIKARGQNAASQGLWEVWDQTGGKQKKIVGVDHRRTGGRQEKKGNVTAFQWGGRVGKKIRKWWGEASYRWDEIMGDRSERKSGNPKTMVDWPEKIRQRKRSPFPESFTGGGVGQANGSSRGKGERACENLEWTEGSRSAKGAREEKRRASPIKKQASREHLRRT